MNPAREVRDIPEEDKGDGAGSGNFVPLSGSISNPGVLSDMGLAMFSAKSAQVMHHHAASIRPRGFESHSRLLTYAKMNYSKNT